MAKMFGSRVLDARAVFPLSTEFRASKGFKQTCNGNRYKNNYTPCNKPTTKLHIVFLVNQTLLMKILDLGTTKHEKLYNLKLYGSSPLMSIYLNNQQV